MAIVRTILKWTGAALALLVASAISGCAVAPFSGPMPSGPVKDSAMAIDIAKRTVFRHRDDPSYEWQVALKNGVWKTIATHAATVHCGDTSGYFVDIQADTGKVVNEELTVIAC